MNKIHKIVTARNTAFIEGHAMDSAENSPTIIEINFDFDPDLIYVVEFSDETRVKVMDVVELWITKITP